MLALLFRVGLGTMWLNLMLN